MMIKLGTASTATKARFAMSGIHDGWKTDPGGMLLYTVGNPYFDPKKPG
jgi:hypothetical protein